MMLLTIRTAMFSQVLSGLLRMLLGAGLKVISKWFDLDATEIALRLSRVKFHARLSDCSSKCQ